MAVSFIFGKGSISTSENKIVGVVDNTLSQDLSKVIKNNEMIDKDEYAKTIKNAQESAYKSMSPTTLSSGSKALEILEQLKTGNTLIYRQVAGNVESQASVISLDGFNEAAAKCGL